MSSEETSDTVDSMKAMILVKEGRLRSVGSVSVRCCDRDLRRGGAETVDVKNPDDCDVRYEHWKQDASENPMGATDE